MKTNEENNQLKSPKSLRKREKYEEEGKQFFPVFSLEDMVTEENYPDSMKYLNIQAMKLKDALHEKYYPSFDPKKINNNTSGKKLKECIVSEKFHPKNVKVNSNILKEVRSSRHTFYTSINRNNNNNLTPTKEKKHNFYLSQNQFSKKGKLSGNVTDFVLKKYRVKNNLNLLKPLDSIQKEEKYSKILFQNEYKIHPIIEETRKPFQLRRRRSVNENHESLVNAHEQFKIYKPNNVLLYHMTKYPLPKIGKVIIPEIFLDPGKIESKKNLKNLKLKGE